MTTVSHSHSPLTLPAHHYSVVIVKATAASKFDGIIALLSSNGFIVANQCTATLTPAQCHRLLHHCNTQQNFQSLVMSLIESPVTVLLVTHPAAPPSTMIKLSQLIGTNVSSGIFSSVNETFTMCAIDLWFEHSRRCFVLFGAPASGKGTQCELLQSAYHLIHISTGELLRKHVRECTAIGKQASAYINAGQLVPDSLITELTLLRIKESDCRSQGFMLDGFPRTATQAQALLANAEIAIDGLVHYSAKDSVLLNRSTGRRFDPVTGKIYHLSNNPAKDAVVAARLIQRSDDTVAIVNERLRTYRATVKPVIEVFQQCRVPVYDIDANGNDIWQIFHRTIEAAEPMARSQATVVSNSNHAGTNVASRSTATSTMSSPSPPLQATNHKSSL